MQPPDGPPVCTALKGLSSSTPPPMSKIICRKRDAQRHFDQAGAASPCRPGRRSWCPCSSRCRTGRTSRRRAAGSSATQARVSTLLMIVGLPHRPGDGGERRAGAGHAALAFDRGDQRGLLAADEGPGALLDLDVKVEARAQDVVAQQTVALRPARWRRADRSRASGYSARQ